MINEQIPEIVEYWSYWNKPIPPSMKRLAKIPAALDPKMVLAIQGVRRCGKSTFLTQLLDRYQLDPLDCLFVNFEDPRLIGALNSTTMDALVTFFRTVRGNDRSLYFFFDEVQNVEGWQKWIHKKVERPALDHFFVTGSNAQLLSRELGSTLTGRHRIITLFPFSYEELRGHMPGFTVEDYIHIGGFPGVVDKPDGDALLRQYFNDIVEKDIVTRLGIGNSRALKQIVKMLFESAGSECSFRKLAGSAGLSADTVANYIGHCEDAYLVYSCPYFSYSEKQRVRRNSKYYPIDPAFRRSIVSQTGRDKGKDFENIVFLALKRLGCEVSYWKGSGEVDLVVQDSRGIWPIQISIEEPKDRHKQALEEFYENFSAAMPETFCGPENFMSVLAQFGQ